MEGEGDERERMQRGGGARKRLIIPAWINLENRHHSFSQLHFNTSGIFLLMIIAPIIVMIISLFSAYICSKNVS